MSYGKNFEENTTAEETMLASGLPCRMNRSRVAAGCSAAAVAMGQNSRLSLPAVSDKRHWIHRRRLSPAWASGATTQAWTHMHAAHNAGLARAARTDGVPEDSDGLTLLHPCRLARETSF
ncbi:hypothetical protein V2G26_015086 [Clonostachys chloroleuca]